jgi:hypothetical protein
VVSRQFSVSVVSRQSQFAVGSIGAVSSVQWAVEVKSQRAVFSRELQNVVGIINID